MNNLLEFVPLSGLYEKANITYAGLSDEKVYITYDDGSLRVYNLLETLHGGFSLEEYRVYNKFFKDKSIVKYFQIVPDKDIFLSLSKNQMFVHDLLSLDRPGSPFSASKGCVSFSIAPNLNLLCVCMRNGITIYQFHPNKPSQKGVSIADSSFEEVASHPLLITGDVEDIVLSTRERSRSIFSSNSSSSASTHEVNPHICIQNVSWQGMLLNISVIHRYDMSVYGSEPLLEPLSVDTDYVLSYIVMHSITGEVFSVVSGGPAPLPDTYEPGGNKTSLLHSSTTSQEQVAQAEASNMRFLDSVDLSMYFRPHDSQKSSGKFVPTSLPHGFGATCPFPLPPLRMSSELGPFASSILSPTEYIRSVLCSGDLDPRPLSSLMSRVHCSDSGFLFCSDSLAATSNGDSLDLSTSYLDFEDADQLEDGNPDVFPVPTTTVFHPRSSRIGGMKAASLYGVSQNAAAVYALSSLPVVLVAGPAGVSVLGTRRYPLKGDIPTLSQHFPLRGALGFASCARTSPLRRAFTDGSLQQRATIAAAGAADSLAVETLLRSSQEALERPERVLVFSQKALVVIHPADIAALVSRAARVPPSLVEIPRVSLLCDAFDHLRERAFRLAAVICSASAESPLDVSANESGEAVVSSSVDAALLLREADRFAAGPFAAVNASTVARARALMGYALFARGEFTAAMKELLRSGENIAHLIELVAPLAPLVSPSPSLPASEQSSLALMRPASLQAAASVAPRVVMDALLQPALLALAAALVSASVFPRISEDVHEDAFGNSLEHVESKEEVEVRQWTERALDAALLACSIVGERVSSRSESLPPLSPISSALTAHSPSNGESGSPFFLMQQSLHASVSLSRLFRALRLALLHSPRRARNIAVGPARALMRAAGAAESDVVAVLEAAGDADAAFSAKIKAADASSAAWALLARDIDEADLESAVCDVFSDPESVQFVISGGSLHGLVSADAQEAQGVADALVLLLRPQSKLAVSLLKADHMPSQSTTTTIDEQQVVLEKTAHTFSASQNLNLLHKNDLRVLLADALLPAALVGAASIYYRAVLPLDSTPAGIESSPESLRAAVAALAPLKSLHLRGPGLSLLFFFAPEKLVPLGAVAALPSLLALHPSRLAKLIEPPQHVGLTRSQAAVLRRIGFQFASSCSVDASASGGFAALVHAAALAGVVRSFLCKQNRVLQQLKIRAHVRNMEGDDDDVALQSSLGTLLDEELQAHMRPGTNTLKSVEMSPLTLFPIHVCANEIILAVKNVVAALENVPDEISLDEVSKDDLEEVERVEAHNSVVCMVVDHLRSILQALVCVLPIRCPEAPIILQVLANAKPSVKRRTIAERAHLLCVCNRHLDVLSLLSSTGSLENAEAYCVRLSRSDAVAGRQAFADFVSVLLNIGNGKTFEENMDYTAEQLKSNLSDTDLKLDSTISSSYQVAMSHDGFPVISDLDVGLEKQNVVSSAIVGLPRLGKPQSLTTVIVPPEVFASANTSAVVADGDAVTSTVSSQLPVERTKEVEKIYDPMILRYLVDLFTSNATSTDLSAALARLPKDIPLSTVQSCIGAVLAASRDYSDSKVTERSLFSVEMTKLRAQLVELQRETVVVIDRSTRCPVCSKRFAPSDGPPLSLAILPDKSIAHRTCIN